MCKCRPIQCVSEGPTDVLVSIAVVPASENTALLPLYLSVDLSTSRYYSLLLPLALQITLRPITSNQSRNIGNTWNWFIKHKSFPVLSERQKCYIAWGRWCNFLSSGDSLKCVHNKYTSTSTCIPKFKLNGNTTIFKFKIIFNKVLSNST